MAIQIEDYYFSHDETDPRFITHENIAATITDLDREARRVLTPTGTTYTRPAIADGRVALDLRPYLAAGGAL